jgi:hypothetical protein
MTVKFGVPSAEQVKTVSEWLMTDIQSTKGRCGQCHFCIVDGKKDRELLRHRLLVNKDLVRYQGQHGLGRMMVTKAKAAHDRTCLLKQAVFAFASARSGLVFRIGEYVFIWHAERRGSVDGEWFRGEILAYDPVPVAHYMQFSRVHADGTVEPVPEYNDWVQLWRSGECLLATNPHVWYNNS